MARLTSLSKMIVKGNQAHRMNLLSCSNRPPISVVVKRLCKITLRFQEGGKRPLPSSATPSSLHRCKKEHDRLGKKAPASNI
jgi:hypothetical protein